MNVLHYNLDVDWAPDEQPLCRMNTNFWPCCFKPPERATGGKPLVTAFQLDEETEADICSGALHRHPCPALPGRSV